MILFVGCSHVLGEELEQDNIIELTNYSQIKKFRENHRFAKILSDKVTISHKVLAESGADNSWITFNTIDFVEKNEDIISNVVVSWSGVTRIQKIAFNTPLFFNPLHPGHGATTSYPPTVPKKFIEDIITWETIENKYFLDINFANLQTYHYINYLTYFLNSKKIDFFYIKGIDSDIDLSQFTQNSIDQSFVNFVTENKFKVGKNSHALKEGHLEWGNHLFEKFKDKFSFDGSKKRLV
jgi:hypothetical protein